MLKEFPFYIKATVILIGLIASIFILAELKDILVPLAFASMFAILLNPLCNRFSKYMPRALAIVISMLIAVIVLAGLVYFLSSQVAHFFDDLDSIKAKGTE